MDWEGLLARKYDILQQNADADTARAGGFVTQANAGANLDAVRAGLLPSQTKSDIALNVAQAGLAGANARNVDETTKYVGPVANAGIGETGARARLYGAQATGEDQINTVRPDLFKLRGLGDNLGMIDKMVRSTLRLGLGPFGGDE